VAFLRSSALGLWLLLAPIGCALAQEVLLNAEQAKEAEPGDDFDRAIRGQPGSKLALEGLKYTRLTARAVFRGPTDAHFDRVQGNSGLHLGHLSYKITTAGWSPQAVEALRRIVKDPSARPAEVLKEISLNIEGQTFEVSRDHLWDGPNLRSNAHLKIPKLRLADGNPRIAGVSRQSGRATVGFGWRDLPVHIEESPFDKLAWTLWLSVDVSFDLPTDAPRTASHN
jgi:hypothetical protein